MFESSEEDSVHESDLEFLVESDSEGEVPPEEPEYPHLRDEELALLEAQRLVGGCLENCGRGRRQRVSLLDRLREEQPEDYKEYMKRLTGRDLRGDSDSEAGDCVDDDEDDEDEDFVVSDDEDEDDDGDYSAPTPEDEAEWADESDSERESSARRRSSAKPRAAAPASSRSRHSRSSSSARPRTSASRGSARRSTSGQQSRSRASVSSSRSRSHRGA